MSVNHFLFIFITYIIFLLIKYPTIGVVYTYINDRNMKIRGASFYPYVR